MSESEKIKALVSDVESVIWRYRLEFEMTAASVVGSLDFIKHGLLTEAFEDTEE